MDQENKFIPKSTYVEKIWEFHFKQFQEKLKTSKFSKLRFSARVSVHMYINFLITIMDTYMDKQTDGWMSRQINDRFTSFHFLEVTSQCICHASQLKSAQ